MMDMARLGLKASTLVGPAQGGWGLLNQLGQAVTHGLGLAQAQAMAFVCIPVHDRCMLINLL